MFAVLLVSTDTFSILYSAHDVVGLRSAAVFSYVALVINVGTVASFSHAFTMSLVTESAVPDHDTTAALRSSSLPLPAVLA